MSNVYASLFMYVCLYEKGEAPFIGKKGKPRGASSSSSPTPQRTLIVIDESRRVTDFLWWIAFLSISHHPFQINISLFWSKSAFKKLNASDFFSFFTAHHHHHRAQRAGRGRLAFFLWCGASRIPGMKLSSLTHTRAHSGLYLLMITILMASHHSSVDGSRERNKERCGEAVPSFMGSENQPGEGLERVALIQGRTRAKRSS